MWHDIEIKNKQKNINSKIMFKSILLPGVWLSLVGYIRLSVIKIILSNLSGIHTQSINV